MTQADLILTNAEERHKGAKADQRDAITRNEVLELLDYDRDTGVFTWKVTIAKGKKGARRHGLLNFGAPAPQDPWSALQSSSGCMACSRW